MWLFANLMKLEHSGATACLVLGVGAGEVMMELDEYSRKKSPNYFSPTVNIASS
jgi:class 3 adenylate cyclase